MKKLLIPLLFLITLPTSAQAGGSYEKVMFKKNIGNYGSLTTVEVKKKYDSFYDKATCIFDPPNELRFYDKSDDNYALVFNGTFIYNYKPAFAFKFDKNPPIILRSMQYGKDPEEKVIPYVRWNKNKQLTVRSLKNEYIFNLKDLVKAINKYKECKKSIN